MNSAINTKTGVFLLAVSIVASSLAQLLLKAGMLSLQSQDLDFDSFYTSMMQVMGTAAVWWVLGGLVFYAVSMFAWLGVLARFALSFAYPFLSLSFVLVYIGAIVWPMLAEPLSLVRLAGILLVVGGTIVVAASGRRT
jgi:undecaprenyl phosphate-alpha-L-ara4N flippase subunit ArnF